MFSIKLLPAAALAALLSGCAFKPPPAPPPAALAPPGYALPEDREPSESPDAARLDTLDAVIAHALLHNPDLQADYKRIEAMLLDVPRMSSLPDPMVSYAQFVDGAQTRLDEQDFIAGISQAFPWVGKRRLAAALAENEARQAAESYRIRMLDLIEEITMAWNGLAYELAIGALAREDRDTLLEAVGTAADLYASGQGSNQGLLVPQLELTRVDLELIGIPQRVEEYALTLGQLLNLKGPLPAAPVLAAPPPSHADPAELVERALRQRPELRRIAEKIDRTGIQAGLAEKDYYPDVTLGVNYIGVGDRPDNPVGMAVPPDEGDDAWNASVGFNIPLPNARRRAAVRQAELEREEAHLRFEAEEERITARLRTLVPRLETLHLQLALLEGELLPRAEDALDASRSDFASSQITYLGLLEARRSWIAVRRDRLAVTRDYLNTLAALERALGAKLGSDHAEAPE